MLDYTNGLIQQCKVFMNENDTTDPATYGSCEIKNGESITLNMEDGTSIYLEYVEDFNLGAQASGIDKNDGIIARY